MQATLTADPIPQSLFVRKVLLDPNFDPQGAPVARLDGEIVGFGLSVVRRVPLEDAPSDRERGYITLLAVAPEARRQGVGTALLARMEGFLRERGCERALVSPYAPNYFIPGVDCHAYADAHAFFLARGYAEVYRPLSMACALAEAQTPDWVPAREETLQAEGVVFEPYRAERIPGLFAFLKAEFPGDWQRVARETIARIEQGEPPTRLWTAREGEAILGFSHHDGERFGPIGVAKEQRGRGLGQVLLYKTLLAMREQGLPRAYFLWSDDKTAARLYTEAGFVEARRFVLLKKELTP